jgi:endogenous inhibitor of DNA gyrase (YacG/DUF329 family)
VYCREHEVVPRFAPFCSERCRLLDLASWIDGKYRVPDERVAPRGTSAPAAAGSSPADDDLEEG